MSKANWVNIVLACLLIFILIRGVSCHTATPNKPVIIAPAEQVKTVAADERTAQVKTDSLQAVIDKQKNITADLKTKLTQAQKNARLIEATLNSLPQDPADTSHQGNSIADYIDNSQLRDSLCNDLVRSQDLQLATKDSIITVKDTLYSKLKVNFNTGIKQQQDLIEYSKEINRQLKLKKVGSTVWKGVAITAGLYILKTLIVK